MKVEYCIFNEVLLWEYCLEVLVYGIIWIIELLYVDDEVIFVNFIEELKIIFEIYDWIFVCFGLKMLYSKIEIMVFNVDEEIKS